MKSAKGFTLIELLIVIAIIAILAAVLIPNLLGARQRAYKAQAVACAKQIATAEEVYQIDSQTYAAYDSLDPGMTKTCSGMTVSGTANSTYYSFDVTNKGQTVTVTSDGGIK
ncbi:prepilin-type N-terminal cleavage/methylation domain-containing protein [Thermus scotoductus]|uniref:Pilin V n=1 Tax=Thermus scotoductus TaxID=37636 RepID=A0A430RU07_THESC|nr:prepilin-type N-terminal cleavage/methylation domain-containing protein [Thermus scotoductus]RTG99104.1 pilin V [Thermus scotoductus]RTH23117.1 pilin V [Thermus scotoductus]